jgi:hypothetical protein
MDKDFLSIVENQMAIDIERLIEEIRALTPEDRRRLERVLAGDTDDENVPLPRPVRCPTRNTRNGWYKLGFSAK